ncbi:LSm family protein [Rhodococcus pyridinivorans]|uniref:Uncharacterized protein n=1 Tax=Rhodococcus pyridinivorans TaxID=103816 RepID=A0A7M2XP54_9NOCA|nr:hypothetical protein [Rhodococcus pyridinivorans]QOV99519.1 hypothetical protein INP59_03710 [Rhodococcus pyridinivorans]
MRRYLKRNIGRPVVVQCWGLAYRGRLQQVSGDGLVLAEAYMLDEEKRQPEWARLDGEVLVPAGAVRFVQVP